MHVVRLRTHIRFSVVLILDLRPSRTQTSAVSTRYTVQCKESWCVRHPISVGGCRNTLSNGQKVFLTWPVPPCNNGCPRSWLNDGYCDVACNVSTCAFDMGDCDGVHPSSSPANSSAPSTKVSHCSPGCANSWVGDRYCDEPCKVSCPLSDSDV